MRGWKSALALAAAACLALGCASGPEQRPRVSYKVGAQDNFIKGKKAFDDGDYLEAIEYLNFVKNKFPFSNYAAEADLLLADCEFARDRFLEAADAYTNFARMHPKHPKVSYSVFRIGLCYFNRMPGDWWLFPPAFELDQDETERAVREIERFLRQFPQDQFAPEARKHLEICQRRLAARVRYVMDFYLKREHPRGVLWRAEELLSKYPGLGFDEEALYRKAQALLQLDDPVQARTAIDRLALEFPQGDYTKKAKDLLAKQPSAKSGSTTGPGDVSR